MTGSWFTELTTWVAGNPGWLVFALFATALIESLAIAGIIVPGVAMLFAFAALAGKTGIPLSEALIWAGLGAVAGDVLSFSIGRLLKGRLDAVWPLSRYPGLIAKGETFFRAHGGKSVIIGRFVGPIRPVIPMVAGALHMPWRTFITFNLLSAVGWALVYILPGFTVGTALASEIKPPPHFYLVLGVSCGVLLVVYLILLQMRLGLGEGSRPYRWLETNMARYDATHRFWRLYTSERPARRGEFPLPSLMMSVTALALFLILAQVVTVSSKLYELNQQVLAWFALLRQPLLDLPMVAFTLAGTDCRRRARASGAGISRLLCRRYPRGRSRHPGQREHLVTESRLRNTTARYGDAPAIFRSLSQRPHCRGHGAGNPVRQLHCGGKPATATLAKLRAAVTAIAAGSPEPAVSGGALVYRCSGRVVPGTGHYRGYPRQLQPI